MCTLYIQSSLHNLHPPAVSPPPAYIPPHPCHPTPCGSNALCTERAGAASCKCMPNYFGDPYSGCRPECIQNTDCPTDKSCQNTRCVDPCVGLCAIDAQCHVQQHQPVCVCADGFVGNPLVQCRRPPIHDIESKCNCETVTTQFRPRLDSQLILSYTYEKVPREPSNPCRPSPCGAYSDCRVLGDRPVCSCQPLYIGAPPNCHPECVSNADCSRDRSCINQRCTDPCPGTCGYNAECRVVNHYPMCTCQRGFAGDPFEQCRPIPGRFSSAALLGLHVSSPVRHRLATESFVVSNTHTLSLRCHYLAVIEHEQPANPCVPSPCGGNANCRVVDARPVCACIANYIGRPPYCRPECMVNSDCASNMACQNERCTNPCVGACGPNAECHVQQHAPRCQCGPGFAGDPYSGCVQHIPSKRNVRFDRHMPFVARTRFVICNKRPHFSPFIQPISCHHTTETLLAESMRHECRVQ